MSYWKTTKTDSLYNTNNLDDTTTTDVTYIGMEDSAGNWLIKKLDESGAVAVITYATIALNAGLTTYALAWADRVAAVYDNYADAT